MSILDSIKNSVFVPIHPSGLPFIIIFCLITLIIGWIWSPLFFIGLILTIWCIYFFRNPERVIPDNIDNNLVVAPADGKIIEIEETIPNEEIGLPKNKYLKIGIFMNVFNVHVNRSPMSGTISKKKVAYSANAPRGSKKNPFVKEGDLITVTNSVFGKTTDVLREITSPFIGIYTAKELIEDFSE